MFVITDHSSSSKKIKLEKTIFNNIDDCINCNFAYESMRSRLASHHSNNSKINPDTNVDLVPITFGNIISRANNHDKISKLNKVNKKNDTTRINNKKLNTKTSQKITTKTSQLRFYWIQARVLL